MRGQVGVESEAGKGSSFWFTAVFEPQAPQRPMVAPTRAAEGLRVLLVESQAASRQAMGAQLRALGCQVMEAADGRAALELLSREEPTEGRVGLALVSQATAEVERQALSRHGFPLIKLTQVGQRAGTPELVCGGFSDQLCKPFRLAQLQQCLTRLISEPAGAPPQAPAPAPQLLSPGQPRLRVLLAEDNHINQLVALKILQSLGYQADVVNDGREALCALEKAPYDLILLDCQMPEMDGFETTRRIRSGEAGTRNTRVPIVALTANAMVSDRQECLLAGMDDYVSKPIDVSELAAAMKRWEARIASTQQAGAEPSAEVGSTAASPPVRPPPLPRPGVKCPPTTMETPDVEGFVKWTRNDAGLAGRIAAGILSDFPVQIGHLRQAIEQGDFPAAARLAHRLWGAARTLGGQTICEVVLDMEQAATNADVTRLRQGVDRLATQYEGLVEAVVGRFPNEPLLAKVLKDVPEVG